MTPRFSENPILFPRHKQPTYIHLAACCAFYLLLFMVQVGAATPIMSGVFAIVRGCKGAEEQAIARAMNVLRGGNPGGFLSELSDREEWQAQREAVMAGLVQRALLVDGSEQWRGGGGRGDGGVTVSSRKLQVCGVCVMSQSARQSFIGVLRYPVKLLFMISLIFSPHFYDQTGTVSDFFFICLEVFVGYEKETSSINSGKITATQQAQVRLLSGGGGGS